MQCSYDTRRPAPVLRATLWEQRKAEARRLPSDILEAERALSHPGSPACECAACAAVYVVDHERAPLSEPRHKE